MYNSTEQAAANADAFQRTQREFNDVTSQRDQLSLVNSSVKHAIDNGDPDLARVYLEFLNLNDKSLDAWNIELVVRAFRSIGVKETHAVITKDHLIAHHEVSELMLGANKDLHGSLRDAENQKVMSLAATHPEDMRCLRECIKERGVTRHADIVALVPLLKSGAASLSDGVL